MLNNLGMIALDEAHYQKFLGIRTQMLQIYSTAKICPYDKKNCNVYTEGISLNPDIENAMATSTDYKRLLYTWSSWRSATGEKIKKLYENYVKLSNQGAIANNFTDRGEMWRSTFESDTFEGDIQTLWEEIQPLYKELHLYVLNKLKSKYKNHLNTKDELIPAHVLGNMWAQNWMHIHNLVLPFPQHNETVTDNLQKQGYTPLKMFQAADKFYQSLGLETTKMSYDVKKGAVIEKPKDHNILCHASAWDFHNGRDFRIKMCTRVNLEDFLTIHHEMGHIQYYLLYKNQPFVFRYGANPGFHEAVGDAISLSVMSSTHLKTLGLISTGTSESDNKTDINDLMGMALERIAFLPFALVVDKWRWDVFRGKVPPNEWNSHWWKLRELIQKVRAPCNRSDEIDFDPGSKFHVAADTQYISYFVAHVLEFQFYKALCIAANQYDPSCNNSQPLHKCDFGGSREAGDKLRAGLSLGASHHWSYALEKITGETTLSSSAMLEYFRPLYEFLKSKNCKGKGN
ncbi:hypothetical protein FQA39_LY07967 [Lamprigera yunnana]|nr:hypothetical protein FQA39_LY07967 [Lamprigera yunnana]